MVATILYYDVIPIKSSNLLLLVYCGNSRRVALFIQRHFPHQRSFFKCNVAIDSSPNSSNSRVSKNRVIQLELRLCEPNEITDTKLLNPARYFVNCQTR